MVQRSLTDGWSNHRRPLRQDDLRVGESCSNIIASQLFGLLLLAVSDEAELVQTLRHVINYTGRCDSKTCEPGEKVLTFCESCSIHPPAGLLPVEINVLEGSPKQQDQSPLA